MRAGGIGERTLLRGAVVLSGASAVTGWSLSAGYGVGAGLGLATAVAVLAGAARATAVPVRDDREPGEGDAGWQEVQRELDRSRRHEHPFVLVRVPCPQAWPADVAGAGPPPSAARVARSLQAFLRSIDSVWASEHDVLLLLPESNRRMGEALVARIRRADVGLLPAAPRIVAFPEDGVTGGALRGKLHGRQVPCHTLTFGPAAGSAAATS